MVIINSASDNMHYMLSLENHFLISIFFSPGEGGGHPPPHPTSRSALPSPLFMTIHAPPSTRSRTRHCTPTNLVTCYLVWNVQ